MTGNNANDKKRENCCAGMQAMMQSGICARMFELIKSCCPQAEKMMPKCCMPASKMGSQEKSQ